MRSFFNQDNKEIVESKQKNNILLLTNRYYQARGREYSHEDLLELSGFLEQYFNVWISSIEGCSEILNQADVVLIRNTGPKTGHDQALRALQAKPNLKLFNDLKGKGDIQGKNYLFELFQLGFPVIPSVASINELHALGSCVKYLSKPLDGADSAGIETFTKDEIETSERLNVAYQPLIDFKYEVSFVFIGRKFYYALYAPNPEQRWVLECYTPTDEDLAFAQRFVEWNTCDFGIQRVDACRLRDGTLLLMELEDYNPYLSLHLLKPEVKQQFLRDLCHSLSELIHQPSSELQPVKSSPK